MKVTSTAQRNKVFMEKDDKTRDWALKETREKNVAMAVMVPLIVSHDGAVHKDTVRQWKDIAPDIQVDCVRMAQSILRDNFVIAGKFFNKGSVFSDAWRMSTPKNSQMNTMALKNEFLLQKR